MLADKASDALLVDRDAARPSLDSLGDSGEGCVPDGLEDDAEEVESERVMTLVTAEGPPDDSLTESTAPPATGGPPDDGTRDKVATRPEEPFRRTIVPVDVLRPA